MQMFSEDVVGDLLTDSVNLGQEYILFMNTEISLSPTEKTKYAEDLLALINRLKNNLGLNLINRISLDDKPILEIEKELKEIAGRT